MAFNYSRYKFNYGGAHTGGSGGSGGGSGGGGTSPAVDAYLKKLMAASDSAKAENLKRYDEGLQIYDAAIKRYQPGGTFEQRATAQIDQSVQRAMGGMIQQNISSGLAGTQVMSGAPAIAEETVGAPARLKLEDLMMERLTQAEIAKAGFIERREDTGPDEGMIAQLMSNIAMGGSGSTNYNPGGSVIAAGGIPFDPNWHSPSYNPRPQTFV